MEQINNNAPQKTTRKKGVLRALALVAIVFIIVIFGGWAWMLCEYTLVNGYVLAGICAAVALALAIPYSHLWARLTRVENKWINAAVHTLVFTVLLSWAVLFINQCRSTHNGEPMNVTVEKVYTETRHRTRRVGRRVYAQGPEYKVYFADINFNGNIKAISLSYEQYKGLHRGDTFDIKQNRGLLGMVVVDRTSLYNQLNKRKITPRRHSRPSKKPRVIPHRRHPSE